MVYLKAPSRVAYLGSDLKVYLVGGVTVVVTLFNMQVNLTVTVLLHNTVTITAISVAGHLHVCCQGCKP